MPIQLHNGDCLDVMPRLPAGSVDAIICDLPYGGVVALDWDTIIPLDKLWAEYERLITHNGAIVLTATQPFTSKLVMSNLPLFKYDWVWNKSRSTDFIRAKLKPMGGHESVLVFSKGGVANGAKNPMRYFPQGLRRVDKTVKNGGGGAGFLGRSGANLGANNVLHQPTYKQEFEGYPNTRLDVASESKTVHPTQKPVALMEYLIRTYTNPGDVVLDNCMGSGTTGVAAVNTGRRFIGIERDPGYFAICQQRIQPAPRVPAASIAADLVARLQARGIVARIAA